MVRLLGHLTNQGAISTFPNAGYPQFFEGRFIYFTTPQYFARSAVELAKRGARLIGGCCGTAPKHIAAMAEALKEVVPRRGGGIAAKSQKVFRREMRLRAGKRTSIMISLPGVGLRWLPNSIRQTLELGKFLLVRRNCKAGCDAIALADNSLAILRVNNLAAGNVAALWHDRAAAPELPRSQCHWFAKRLDGNGGVGHSPCAGADRRSGEGG